MVASFCLKSQAVRRLLSVVMICALLPNGAAWGVNQPPLSRIPVPVPRNLSQFVVDKNAAIRLGKALFWDMQAGSDGVTACATCHFNAGADNRLKNQLHPGPDGIFATISSALVPTKRTFGPNYTLKTDPFSLGDFPFFQINPVVGRVGNDTVQEIDPITGLPEVDPVTGLPVPPAIITRNLDDVTGSQGVRLADFLAVNNTALDSGTPLADQVFHIGPILPNADPANNVRRVTKRNAPSVFNAVFNYTNFWDGRANNIFNGSTPFGPLDQAAGIWIDNGTELVKQKIAIPNASLASQAVGQAVSDDEMSFRGRTFPELGRKMLALAPLATQFVHPQDSVLGAFSRDPLGDRSGSRGIDIGVPGPGPGNNTYRTMIEAAFVNTLWQSGNRISLPTAATPAGELFDQIEANFSLFWGLAIQLYEATLVSDRTPFDLFQLGNQNAMSFSAQKGFTTFDSKCVICHSGSELTSAAVGSNPPNCVVTIADPNGCNPPAFTNNTTHNLIKQGLQNDAFLPPLAVPGIVTFDEGFFNTGVRPTVDDPGRGGDSGLDNPVLPGQKLPLSFTRLAVLQANGQLPAGITVPLLPPLAPVNQADTVLGAFKTPGLRNVELTAPYFHNGSAFTLLEVVEFYARGGNSPQNPELADALQPIGALRGDPVSRQEVADFLVALTDNRVRNQSAPFDHPELLIPNGSPEDFNDPATIITIPPTGGAPAAVAPGLTLNPVVTPTLLTSQVISGTISDAAKATTTVAVRVNNRPAAVATVKCVPDAAGTICVPSNTWSFTATGLNVGTNTIEATATDWVGGSVESVSSPTPIQVLPSATISGIPPGGSTKQNFATLTIGGAGVVSYQYSLDGSQFSADIPVATPIVLGIPVPLSDGTHTIAVLGKDAAGNQQPLAFPATGTWTVKANPPVLTLDAASLPTGSSTQTISGTVELGSIPSVSVDTAATVGPVRTVSGAWSCEISNLVPGVNNFTVIAQDFVFNRTTVTGIIKRILPDGNIVEDGVTDLADALKALRIAVNLEQPTVTDMLHGDVAPLVNGLPTRNNAIDIADALLILRKTVGLVTF